MLAQGNLLSCSHDLSQFPILVVCGLKFSICVFFLQFFVVGILAYLDFSFHKTSLALVCYIL